MVRRRLAACALLVLPLTGCHPTVRALHGQAASFIPGGARIVEARDGVCREFLGAHPTCRDVRWQHPRSIAENAPAMIATAERRGWRVARQRIDPQRRYVTFERSNWRVGLALWSRRLYRPTMSCPALRSARDGSDFATTCSQSVNVMWTGADTSHDIELGLLVGALIAGLAGLALRGPRAFWVLAATPLVYGALGAGVLTPGRRPESWLAQLLIVMATAAAACSLGIFVGRLPRYVHREGQ